MLKIATTRANMYCELNSRNAIKISEANIAITLHSEEKLKFIALVSNSMEDNCRIFIGKD